MELTLVHESKSSAREAPHYFALDRLVIDNRQEYPRIVRLKSQRLA